MKTKYLILLLFVTVTFSSCKKDYPNDIPDWIKTYIKNCKIKNECCGPAGCILIEEWEFNDIRVYSFAGGAPMYYQFFDYQGNKLCIFIGLDFYVNSQTHEIYQSPACGNINLVGYKRKRTIWYGIHL